MVPKKIRLKHVTCFVPSVASFSQTTRSSDRVLLNLNGAEISGGRRPPRFNAPNQSEQSSLAGRSSQHHNSRLERAHK